MAGFFAQLGAKLNLDISDFSAKLSQASASTKSFAAGLRGKTVTEMEALNRQTKAWGLNLKSVSRVVSGILISQTFYRALQSIQSATSAVWEFTKQLEYAQIAYSNLFGDVALATEFINVLKDFAAESPFSFTDAEAAAKRLLAYGIEYKNVMYVMQGVMSASAIQGDSAKIEAISRAFGQIYTYGKLMTQEVRQLSEAGIPAYEILQEELGLSQQQLRNLGNEGIAASDAINALVDGIQKRFGSVTVAAAKTTTGIISNIKDNATMLFSSIFEPFTTFIKSALVEVGEFFYAMRELNELKGIGGVFEALVPEELQGMLRTFAANVSNAYLAVARLVYALSGLLKPILLALIQVYNAFSPILATVINALAGVVSIITSNATAMKYLTAMLAAAASMWVLFKVKAIASAVVSTVILGISKALAGLSAMLTFVLAHPFWALLIGLTGVLIGISGGFGAISDKVSGFFKQITQFNGVDPDKILLPSQKERANDLDKFNKRLDGTSDAMDDLADSTGKATKAAKGLLSFDEVFKLNEPDEGSGKGIVDPNLEELLEGLDGLGSTFMPEVPDFSEYMKLLSGNFLEKLKEAWDAIKEQMAEIVSSSIGAVFGGLIGALFGGKIGGIFGAVAGAIVGYFWNMLADYFGLSPDQKVQAGIIGGVGAAIGAILGAILGGPFGAKLGAIIGGLVGSFWGIFAEHLGVVPEQHIATLISGALSGAFAAGINLAKSLIANLTPVFIDDVFAGFAKSVGFSLKSALAGALKQGVVGAIVGLVTGMLANALTAWIAEELNLTAKDLENAGTGQIVGSIIGSITGLILGGPTGALVGGALGQLAGSIVGEFWAYLNATLKGTLIGTAAGVPTGAIVGTLIGSIGGPAGAAIGAAVGAALGALIGLIVDNWDTIKAFVTDVNNAVGSIALVISGMFSVGESVAEFLSPLGEKISGAFTVAKETVSDFFGSIGSTVSNALNPVKDSLSGVGTFITDIFSGAITVFMDVRDAVSTVWSDILLSITTVLSDIWTSVETVWNDVSTAITTVCNAVWDIIVSVWELIRDLTIKVFTDIWNALVKWFMPIAARISSVCTAVWTAVSNTFSSMFTYISQTLQSVWNTVSSTFLKIYNKVSQTLQSVWNSVSTIFISVYNIVSVNLSKAWNAVKSYFTNIYSSIKNALSSALETVKTFFTSIYGVIRDKVTGAYSVVRDSFTNIYSSVKERISSMYSTVKDGISNLYKVFTDWISNLWDNVFGKFFGWISEGIDNLREFFGLSDSGSSSAQFSAPSSSYPGHATGGIFNREHLARFAEGNKAEAVIPLENASAMQPFVDAVANGITATLGPVLANFTGGSSMPPLYVGTLIADDKSLKELERKMQVIRMQENRR